jgi:hemoglobin/transferrin/lactoferrin receptor protein
LNSTLKLISTCSLIFAVTHIYLQAQNSKPFFSEQDETESQSTNLAPQPTEPLSEDVLEVVVSATKSPRNINDVPGTVNYFNAEDLQSGRVNNLGDFGRYNPGISAARATGGAGPGLNGRSGYLSINIRGIDGNRNLLLIDGIRAPEEFRFGNTSSIGRDYYDLSGLKSVEVVKGASSSLYGSDAIGGVVSYATWEPADLLGRFGKDWYLGTVAAYDSSDASFSETVRTAVRGGPVEALFLYTRRDGEEKSSNGSFGDNPQEYQSNYFLGKLHFQITSEQVLKVALESYEKETQTDLLSSNGRLLSTNGPRINFTNIDDDISRKRIDLKHVFTAEDPSALWSGAEASLYFQTSGTDEYINQQVSSIFGPPNPRLRIRDYEYNQDLIGGTLLARNVFETGDVSHQLTYGLDISHSYTERDRNAVQITLATNAVTNVISPDTFPLKDIPDTDILRAGVYAQDEITLGQNDWLNIIPGLRVDYYDLSTNDDPLYLRASQGTPSQGFDEVAASPKLGLLAKVSRHWNLYTQLSQGFRGPTPEDLNATINNTAFNYQTIPNPSLESETSYGIEWGTTAEYEFLKFRQSFYYNYYQNFLQPLTLIRGTGAVGDPLIYQTINLKEAEIYGLESSLEFPLGYWSDPLKGLSVIFKTGHSIGNDLENNRPLNSVDPFKFVSILRYKEPKDHFGVDLIGTFTEKKHRVDKTALATQFVPGDSYVLDLVGYWKPWQHLTASLGIYNLANRQHFLWQNTRDLSTVNPDVDRYTESSTSIRASVTLEF